MRDRKKEKMKDLAFLCKKGARYATRGVLLRRTTVCTTVYALQEAVLGAA